MATIGTVSKVFINGREVPANVIDFSVVEKEQGVELVSGGISMIVVPFTGTWEPISDETWELLKSLAKEIPEDEWIDL